MLKAQSLLLSWGHHGLNIPKGLSTHFAPDGRCLRKPVMGCALPSQTDSCDAMPLPAQMLASMYQGMGQASHSSAHPASAQDLRRPVGLLKIADQGLRIAVP